MLRLDPLLDSFLIQKSVETMRDIRPGVGVGGKIKRHKEEQTLQKHLQEEFKIVYRKQSSRESPSGNPAEGAAHLPCPGYLGGLGHPQKPRRVHAVLPGKVNNRALQEHRSRCEVTLNIQQLAEGIGLFKM